MNRATFQSGSRMLRHALLGASMACASIASLAATTDISNVPLFTSSGVGVKPNIMFILDDSGSMASDYMPDDVAGFGTARYGKFTSQCNGLAYNPSQTYNPPVNADGSSQAAGSLTLVSDNPNSHTYTQRNVTSPTTLTVASTGTLTLTISGASGTNWYATGDVLNVFSSGNTSAYMLLSVQSFNQSTGTITANIVSAVGTGTTFSTGIRVGSDYRVYYTYSGTQTAMDYVYSKAGVDTSTTFYKECNSVVDQAPGSSVFTRQVMTAASASAQNYANWYAYYRYRLQMMKTAVSQAFKGIDDRYRVGFSTISEKTAVSGAKFLDIKTFDATQKSSFYTTLFNSATSGNTPLRGALSKAGQYFGNKAYQQTSDPMQYSCQKNFTILSTDGYWNTGLESTSPPYGPYDMKGNKVGEQDAYPTDRPMRDGSTTTVTRKITWTKTETKVTQTDTTTTSFTGALKHSQNTYTPSSGTLTTTYTAWTKKIASTSNSSISCTTYDAVAKTCTVTVQTNSVHGFETGDKVTISSASSPYNVTGVTITVTGSQSYTFTLTGQNSKPANASSKGSTAYVSGGCPVGQGSQTKTVTETDTFKLTTATWNTAQATDTTAHSVNQAVTPVPYTETILIVDGVQTSDTTAAGTAGTTVNTALPAAPNDVSAAYAYTSSTTTSAPTTATPPGYTPTVTTYPSQCYGSAQSGGTSSVAPTSPAVVQPETTSSTTLPSQPKGSPTTTTQSDTFVDGTKTTTDTSSTANGSTDSLADVAMYYYKTDLRDKTAFNNCTGALGSDVCGTSDSNPTQNMVTFTLGLGVNGTLKYDPNYLKQTSGDFYDVTQGTKNWPVPTVSSSGGDPTNVDDLWHAAVNGHGQYFSARNPSDVVKSLANALNQITKKTGAGSAASTSTLQPVDGDNDVFVAQFTSAVWSGELLRYTINPADGTISTTPTWKASAVLAARVADTTNPRKVYYFKPGSGNTGSLQAFTYTNLTADGLGGNFSNFCSKTGAGGSASPSQCANFDAATTTLANSGSNLVDYLLGKEQTTYRARVDFNGNFTPLGDIINSPPLYVGAPKFKYTENGYGTFQSAHSTRPGTVYVGANDGMLHAFDRSNGQERWAYIPSTLIPKLYKLADEAYANNHQVYVDGASQVGDIFVGGQWKTILVAGLNAGGRSYFALDITDQDNPKALWEFKDDNLGLTFGNPVITKRKDGTWVVVFGSGYNNVSPGDGNGHLFVLDANTGAKVSDFSSGLPTYTSGSTPAGTASTPSGLAKINAFVDSDIDNTAKMFYGGDLLGNLWRFDLDSQVKPFGTAFLLATLKGSTGKPQPITTKPAIADLNFMGSHNTVVYVATGEYLGGADLSNTDPQTIYAIKDPLTDVGLGDVRAGGTLVTQTLTTATGAKGNVIRTGTSNKVDWSTNNGWMVDLPSTGERVSVNPLLALNVLTVASNIPTSSACDAGGQSWLYQFDIGTGSAVSNAADGAVGTSLGNVLIVGVTEVQLPNGQTVTITTDSTGELGEQNHPPPPASGSLKRTSWRELTN